MSLNSSDMHFIFEMLKLLEDNAKDTAEIKQSLYDIKVHLGMIEPVTKEPSNLSGPGLIESFSTPHITAEGVEIR